MCAQGAVELEAESCLGQSHDSSENVSPDCDLRTGSGPLASSLPTQANRAGFRTKQW